MQLVVLVWELGCLLAVVSEAGVQKIGVHALCDRSENAADGAKFLPPTRMQASHSFHWQLNVHI